MVVGRPLSTKRTDPVKKVKPETSLLFIFPNRPWSTFKIASGAEKEGEGCLENSKHGISVS